MGCNSLFDFRRKNRLDDVGSTLITKVAAFARASTLEIIGPLFMWTHKLDHKPDHKPDLEIIKQSPLYICRVQF